MGLEGMGENGYRLMMKTMGTADFSKLNLRLGEMENAASAVNNPLKALLPGS